MKILAKAAATKEQLQGKVDAKASGIEIQLLSELVDGKVGQYHFADEVFDLDMMYMWYMHQSCQCMVYLMLTLRI